MTAADTTELLSRFRGDAAGSTGARCLGIACLTAVALALSPTAASARNCGNLRTYYRENGTRQWVGAMRIIGEGLRCPRARHVAWDWARRSRLSYRPATRGAGFRCHYNRAGSDVGTVVCIRGSMVVTFDAEDGSPYH